MDQNQHPTLPPAGDDGAGSPFWDDSWLDDDITGMSDIDLDLLTPATPSSTLDFLEDDEDDDWGDIPDIDPDLLTPDIAELLDDEGEWPEDLPDIEPDLLAADRPDSPKLPTDAVDEDDEEFVLPTPAIFIATSPDKMAAFLTIEQDPPIPYQATIQDVQVALTHSRIEFGILHDKIEEIIVKKQYPSYELIAEGRPMLPGVDGRLEYVFSFTEGGRPKDMGYRVDHFDLNLVRNVNAGDVLVRKFPPQPGKEGMTVQGRLINTPKLRDPRLPEGKGTRISDEDPLELIAETDGFVRLDRRTFDQVIVDQVFEIHGNVDMSVGNLDVEGGINIKRNVNEGFSVKATGDITIHGLVESSYIEAGGSIEIKGGIIGGLQHATMKAEGNIIAKFANQATVIAGRNIYIMDEAVNCILQAEEKVVVGEGSKLKGAIVGGRVSAGQEIRTSNSGSDTGIHTRLRVGERPSMVRRRRNMETEILKEEHKLTQLNVHIQAMTEKLASRVNQRDARAAQMTTLQTRQTKLYHRVKMLMEQAQSMGLLAEPDETIEIVNSEIETTGVTLQRVDAHIASLQEKKAKVAGELSVEDKETLNKLQIARHNLTNKLTDMRDLLAKQKNRWSKESRVLWRDLQLSRTDLESVHAKIQQLKNDDALNQKIEHVLPHMESERETITTHIAHLKDELEILKEEIANAQRTTPKVIITDKLWPGTEAMITTQKRRFSKIEQSVSIQLVSDDDEERIVVRSLFKN